MKPWHFLICFPLQTIQIFGTPPARSKIPYQNSVNNMSFSCLLIIELFWANLLRFCNWGYKVQRRCSGVTTSWGLFFYLLSLFHFLGLRFWKGIIKQVSANWQEEHTMVDKKKKEKKNYKVTPRGKSRKLHSKHTHTRVLKAFSCCGTIPSWLLLCFHC